MREVAEGEPVNASNVRPFAPRHPMPVPQDPANAVTVLSFIVPTGYQLWIKAYAFDLFPSTTNELNYAWRIFIDGQDILNASDQELIYGRPQRNNLITAIGDTKESQKLALPGNVVEIVVQAKAAVPASDRVSATLFGNLEPAQ
jgi:hypothetical protein